MQLWGKVVRDAKISATHYSRVARAASEAVIFGGGLGRQGELEFLHQQLQLGLGLCVAREGEFAAIGGEHEYIDHLHGGELLVVGDILSPSC
jgi:hypothetical protein